MASTILAWKAGAILTSVGIGAGAFGAHALKARLGDSAATWSMASNYAIFNGGEYRVRVVRGYMGSSADFDLIGRQSRCWPSLSIPSIRDDGQCP